jgi:hypothetical protein
MLKFLLFVTPLLAASCATVNVDSDDDDTGTETGTEAIPCDEDDAEELCGDPELCVDGYCCDSTCLGGCNACDLAGLEGTCSPMAADTVCRAAAGICDAAEVCDGEGAQCPEDGLLGQEVECRAAVDECDVAEHCDGLSADGCPEDGFAAQETACGSDNDDECDAPDTCDGAGACLPNHEPAETACGDQTGSECDAPDTCDGEGTCLPNHEPDFTACGDATDTICDGADTCDGDGSCAPNHAAADTACGDTTEAACDHADTCDGAGACEANLEPGTTVCRPAVNDCDYAESCDGLGACPADATKSPGDSCGDPSDTECTNPDTCSAALVCQPNHELSTVPCATATACEIAAHCDGAGECGGGGFLPEDTPCGSTLDTECDDPDSCDAAGSCLPNLELPGTTCGDPSDTGCTDPDTCDGAGTCAQNHELVGTSCGDLSNTDCTNPDACDGSGTCLANHEPSGTSCGDPSETTCNHADTCNGGGTCAQNLEPTTTVCRPAAAGGCDVAESCTALGACPADGFAAIGTSCGSGPAVCSGQDTCDGTGGCLPNDYPTTTTCGTTVDEYQCSATGCYATPQGRTVGQHCSGGACVTDTGVPWTDLESACLADEVCLANSSDAWCDVCDALPADYCSGGNAYHYTGTGSCSGGSCAYTPTMETCASGCTNGVCNTCPGSIWASNSHCYWYVSTGATWDAAEAACAAQGGHLVSITSSAENDFARGVAPGDFWIGLRDYATASSASGNCDDCTENCVASAQRYTFDTCDGYDDQVFTCGGDGWFDFQFKYTPPATQYYVLSSPTAGRFLALSNYINSHGSTMACYGGTDYACGNPLIYSLASGTPILIHVDGTSTCGATTIDVRRFVFTDGAGHTWHNWSSGEPNNSGDTEDCGEVYDATGVWNDLPCSSSLPYVCERL